MLTVAYLGCVGYLKGSTSHAASHPGLRVVRSQSRGGPVPEQKEASSSTVVCLSGTGRRFGGARGRRRGGHERTHSSERPVTSRVTGKLFPRVRRLPSAPPQKTFVPRPDDVLAGRRGGPGPQDLGKAPYVTTLPPHLPGVGANQFLDR